MKVYKVYYTDKYSKYSQVEGLNSTYVYSENYTSECFERSSVMETELYSFEEITGDNLMDYLYTKTPRQITRLHSTLLVNCLSQLGYEPEHITVQGEGDWRFDYTMEFFNPELRLRLRFSNKDYGGVYLYMTTTHPLYTTLKKYGGKLSTQIGRWMSDGTTTESWLDFRTIEQIIGRIKDSDFGK